MLTDKQQDTIAQLKRACEEMAVGFRMMGERAEITDEDWVIVLETLDALRAAVVLATFPADAEPHKAAE